MDFRESRQATRNMQTSSRRKNLILFDLDGVLLDSRANMDHAWAAVRAELGIRTPFDAYFAEIGRPFADIMTRLGLAHQRAAIEAVFRRASGETMAETPFYPGAAAMLRELAADNRKLGIVTSKDSARTALVLDRLPVSFAVVKSPDEICRGKPAPDSLLMAMAMCNVDPADSVFIGDMDSDAMAAERANIDYVHAAWGYGDTPRRYTAAVNNCAELLAYLVR